MNTFLDPAIIMPILTAIIILIIALVLILVIGKNKQIEKQAISRQAFEQLVNDLKADNEFMKSELAIMKETLNSINKMMEDV